MPIYVAPRRASIYTHTLQVLVLPGAEQSRAIPPGAWATATLRPWRTASDEKLATAADLLNGDHG